MISINTNLNNIKMFQNIKLNEAMIFAKQGIKGFKTDNGTLVKPKSKKEILEEIELIDDLLSIMKSKMLLNKKKGLKAVIDGRISISVAPETIRIGGNNKF